MSARLSASDTWDASSAGTASEKYYTPISRLIMADPNKPFPDQ